MNTEIIVTLENGADSNLISSIIENIKGVLKASVQKDYKNEKDTRHEEWMQKINELSKGFDPSLIDMNDERTRYIMSK
ncbi:MAG: hypothetical protein K2H38_06715 [Muribaculaceae bacterium]|nr:hypothetical protein [Muribaculaceae bacterium]MDE6552817.1 hypothetical protein [Muribaculaceae bacterium]